MLAAFVQPLLSQNNGGFEKGRNRLGPASIKLGFSGLEFSL